MQEVTFETESQRLKREADEKREAEQERHNEFVQQRDNATSAAAYDKGRQADRLRFAADDVDAAAIQGQSAKARLQSARQRAADLRGEIEAAPELRHLREEAEGIENRLASTSLLTARADTVAHLNYLKTLVALWPKRKEVLLAELAAAEAEAKALEAELPLIARAYTAAVKVWEAVTPKPD